MSVFAYQIVAASCTFEASNKNHFYEMKLFNKPNGLLLGVAAAMVLTSCQQDEVLNEVEETPGVQITAEDITTIENFVYEYKGTQYTEQQWADYSEANGLGLEDFYATSIDRHVLVFDTETERKAFEDNMHSYMMGETNGVPAPLQKYQWISQYSPKGEATEGDTQTTYYAVLRWYEHKDYGGWQYNTILSGDLYLEQKWWGWDIGNNVIEANFPSAYRNKISSYRWDYYTLPAYGDAFCVYYPKYSCSGTSFEYCEMEVKVHTGPLNDKGVTWTKDMYWYPDLGVRQTHLWQSNWHDNRIWGALGIGNWGDQVESYTITFRL